MREEGYYWVRFYYGDTDKVWHIAHWTRGCWNLPGYEVDQKDSDMEEIDERRLTRMTHEDEQCLKLGRHVSSMISAVHQVSDASAGYARHNVEYPGGALAIFIATEPIAEIFEAAAALACDVTVMDPTKVVGK